jgi:hypothetical protein
MRPGIAEFPIEVPVPRLDTGDGLPESSRVIHMPGMA